MATNVGIRPNAGDVHAIVKASRSENETAHVVLNILNVRDYESMPNFINGKIGEDIEIVVSKDDLNFFKVGKEVDVLVSVSGDQRGQFYTATLKK